MALGGIAFDKFGRPIVKGKTTTPTPTPAPAAAPATPAPAAAPAATDPAGAQSATALATGILQGWGLPTTLLSSLTGWITSGITDSSALGILLQQTPEYQARFPANAERIKNGLPPLQPADYVAVENSYRQIMASAGLPKGFYDSDSDFTNMIAGDMSPTELQGRVTTATHLVNQTDPQARDALQSYYGIDSGHLIAHFLDPSTAAPLLDKQAAAAQIGGAALAQGLALTNKQKAEGYADQGVTGAAALKAYGQVAQVLPTEGAIAQRFGQTFDQSDAEDQLLGGLASAQRKAQTLNSSEAALFSGGTGLASTAYGGATRANEIGTPSQGSY